MKRWTVIVAPRVWDLIATQVLHIAEHSIDNALAWEGRLEKVIFKLEKTAGFAIDEDASDRLGVEVRKVVFEGTYLVHFVLDPEAGAVKVIGFRHGARLPKRGEP